ncbi:MAG TPA: sigma-70 family RNA polymerase sigma factor [Anaeromyxobacteraceae bacterium]|nr:sigma-70 family RNA polymerase sigma factor [Anaeromyxobacteraceae bacterium]
MAPDPDAALLLAFQRGDEAAFRTLFEKYARPMVAFCHRFVRDAARAEELAQDVFLKVHRSAARWRPEASVRAWLYRIASNHCLNELRRGEYAARRSRGRGEPGPLDPDALPGGGATPEDSVAGEALSRAVEALLRSMPEKQRVAFVLCRFEGLSYEEIARSLDTSVSAVKSLIHRATVRAAEALAPLAGTQLGKEALP